MPHPEAPVTIVTGSSRGIGAAVAEALAGAGHRLVLVARGADRLEAVARKLRDSGAEVATFAGDLRDPAVVVDAVRATERHFGAPDIIVNNAGTAPSDKVENTSSEMLQEAYDLHVAAPLAFARACAAAMKQRGSGCLLQLASTAGLQGYPFTSAYTAAKHGMVGLTRALHAELAPRNIEVYAVCPGFVDSDITRQAAAAVAAKGKSTAQQALARMGEQNRIGRMHTCEEVAAAVLHLLRDRPQGCVFELDRDPAGFLD
ncbi:MAG: SDR family oxidoreductase [Planctomycetota bacterium]|nr:SDR family oxidoreductase [Planctomycetota bacterium]